MFVLAPIYYMALISFRSPNQYLSANAWLPTGGLSLSSYSAIFHATAVGTDFRDSGELAVGTIVVVVTLSLAAGYRIVRRGSRYSAVSFRLILFGIAIPIQAIVIPLYFITNKLHIYDTLYGLVLVLSASLIPVAVLLMVNYLRLIPRQLYDAMAVDGAGPLDHVHSSGCPHGPPSVGCYQHLRRSRRLEQLPPSPHTHAVQ